MHFSCGRGYNDPLAIANLIGFWHILKDVLGVSPSSPLQHQELHPRTLTLWNFECRVGYFHRKPHQQFPVNGLPWYTAYARGMLGVVSETVEKSIAFMICPKRQRNQCKWG